MENHIIFDIHQKDRYEQIMNKKICNTSCEFSAISVDKKPFL